MNKDQTPLCTLICYDKKQVFIDSDLRVSEAALKLSKTGVNWLNIESIESSEVSEFGKIFNIHPLIVDDILNTELLPKFEVFDNMIFFSSKMLSYDEVVDEIVQEHVSIILNNNLIITIQEGLPGDVFNQLRDRIEAGKGFIRKYDVDFLFYNVLNSVLEKYLDIIEKLRTKTELLEDKMLGSYYTENIVSTVIKLKRDYHLLRTYTIPTKDALYKMRLEGSKYIKKSSVNYFQDLQDHIQYLIASFDTSREMLKDLLDIHSSNQNMEMNRIMKTLTVISAIFIPLTFIAGVYGMNFEYMPELEIRWGYAATICLMMMVSIGMAFYMRFKKWF
jgi:magnesium transporter